MCDPKHDFLLCPPIPGAKNIHIPGSGILNDVLHPKEAAKSWLGDAVKDYIANPIFDALSAVERWLLNSFLDGFVTIATSWMGFPEPNLEGPDSAVTRLQENTNYYMAAIALVAVMVGGARIALRQRGQDLGELGKDLLKLGAITLVGVPVAVGALQGGDAFSLAILQAAHGDKGDRFAEVARSFSGGMFLLKTGTDPGGTMSAGALLTVLLGLVAVMLQTVLMAGRNVALVLLIGLLPLAAAFGVSGGMGRRVRDRYLSWLVSLILYKPVVATIYAAVLWIWVGKVDVTTFLTGVAGICMAIFALPALVRLVAPAVSVGTAAWSEQRTVSRAGGTVALANGAITLGRTIRGLGGGRGGGAPAGAPRPPAAPAVPATVPQGIPVPGAGAAAGGAGAGGAGAGGAAAAAAPALGVAAVVVAAAAVPVIVAKKIGRTAASGIGEEDY